MSVRDLPAIPVTPTLLRSWPLPAPGSDKLDRGTVLVVGGSRKTPGAALLAGTAALRAGAGRLTLAVAESTAVALAVALPEAGVIGLPETSSGSVRSTAHEALQPELESAEAVLIGPGLDDADETAQLLRNLVVKERIHGNQTIVLDAYALGVLRGLLPDIQPWAGHLILTPNLTELGLLLGQDPEDIRNDIAEVSHQYQAVVSCQGVIVQPPNTGPADTAGSTDCWEITTGSGGLGTSGSGDVLAGTIAGLRARGTTDAQAACWGSHLHAAAGDRLASRKGSPGYLARELADELPPLMMELNT
ncbi:MULTISPECIES: NAD(P)H-hydrate dehydratase [unclassified Arthrobacter]|uniref:NAD(P)H-hydrate dehydratase n=1 Tax=unclassified Arthrobacter TaxID=235627 RepID=UPI002227BFE3|nr:MULTISPECIES: NAD(P)H-hydrate dehydratase [unclassified Arthrobacter]UYY80257.1 NAD(P)H-hydrate dehydratase [Arthrobacter sp. YA7-1]